MLKRVSGASAVLVPSDERLGRKKWAEGLGLRGEGGGSSDIASHSLATANRVYPSEVKRGRRNSEGGLEFVQWSQAPLKEWSQYPEFSRFSSIAP